MERKCVGRMPAAAVEMAPAAASDFVPATGRWVGHSDRARDIPAGAAAAVPAAASPAGGWTNPW